MRDDWESTWPLAIAVWLLVGMVLWSSGAFAQDYPREADRYRFYLTRQARLVWGLDAPVATMAAQVHQESGWRKDAVSPVGASGLAQFMPATAKWICGKHAYPELPLDCNTMNPAWALRAMALYDKHLYDRLAWAGAECTRWWFSLRSYNGGEVHLVKEARLAADPTTREGVDAQCGRASRNAKHCAENLSYPRKIIKRHQPKYLSWGRGVCS